jgi:SAM-dependent methyltransferase
LPLCHGVELVDGVAAQRPSFSQEGANLDCYEDGWLEEFEHAQGRDLALQVEEMSAFDTLVSACDDRMRARSAFRYLDIGTCTGRYLMWALDKGFGAVHGLDSSQHAVAFSRRKLQGLARIVQADILVEGIGEKLSLTDMDLVSIMFGTFNHFSRAQQQIVLCNARACLREGGSLVISSWQPGKCDFSIYDATARDLLASRGLSLTELRASVAAWDLEVVDWAYTSSKLVARIQRTSGGG